MSEQRLDRIERNIESLNDKMDKQTELMGAVIRMEEKFLAHSQRTDQHEVRLNKHSEEIDVLQVHQAQNQTKTNTNEWFVRLMIAALVSAIAYIARG